MYGMKLLMGFYNANVMNWLIKGREGIPRLCLDPSTEEEAEHKGSTKTM